MRLRKVLLNSIAAASICLGAHTWMKGGLLEAANLETGVSIVLCVATNLLGLFQRPPQSVPRPLEAAPATG